MTGFVRTEEAAVLPPPMKTSGLVYWARTNLFATPLDSVMTLFAAALLVGLCRQCSAGCFLTRSGPALTAHSAPRSNRAASSRTAGPAPAGLLSARSGSSSCSAAIRLSEYWRALADRHLVPCAFRSVASAKVPRKALNAMLFFGVFPVIAYFLLAGGSRPVRSRNAALGRADGHAGHLLCRHRRVAAARHCSGARAPLENADRQNVLPSVSLS